MGIFGRVRQDLPLIRLRKGARPARGTACVLKLFVVNVACTYHGFPRHVCMLPWPSASCMLAPVPCSKLLALSRSALQAFTCSSHATSVAAQGCVHFLNHKRRPTTLPDVSTTAAISLTKRTGLATKRVNPALHCRWPTITTSNGQPRLDVSTTAAISMRVLAGLAN